MCSKNHNKHEIVLSGYIGLFAAIFVGAGEFLLHYDPLSRFSETGYEFMLSATDSRQSLGHFIGVLSAPLYVIGCWHIYLMLKPGGKSLALSAFLVGAYGFMIGADWISSRASIGAITHLQQAGTQLDSLVELYKYRYENLLTVIRIATLLLSLIYIFMVLKGKTHYDRWMAFFNPIALLLLSFVVFFIAPGIGKFMMPIALNIGFGLFFILSILQAGKIKF